MLRWMQLLGMVLIIMMIGCQSGEKEGEMGKRQMKVTTDINAVKEAHTDSLMKIPGVVGVYVGELDDGTPCIGVMVKKLTPAIEEQIPRQLDGYPVRVEETGDIRPMEGKRK